MPCATPVRVRPGQSHFAIRHTGGARVALKLSWRYVEAFETEAAQFYTNHAAIAGLCGQTAHLVHHPAKHEMRMDVHDSGQAK